MSSQLQQQNKSALRLAKCRIRFFQFEQFSECSIVFYVPKYFEVFYETGKPHFNKNSNNVQQTIPMPSVIHFGMDYVIQVGKTDKNTEASSQQQLSITITLYKIQNLEKKAIEIEILQQKKDQLISYFTGKVWIKQPIRQRYQLIRQIYPNRPEVSLCSSQPEGKFLLLRDNQTFQNYFVKVYEREYEKKSKRIGKNGNRRKKVKEVDLAWINREVHYQNMIRHKNVMRFSQFIYTEQSLYLFYEEKPTKLLSHHLGQGCKLSSYRIKDILKQLLRVIIQMQSYQILHNNIRVSSIFIIQSNQNWKICLGQFQYATPTTNNEPDYAKVIDESNKHHMAPQLIKKNILYQERTDNCDLFSLGLVFYYMLFRKNLFKGLDGMEKRVKNDSVNFSSKEFRILSQKSLDLLQRMLDYDPSYRITPHEALQHQNFSRDLPQDRGQTMLLRSFKSSMNTTSSFENAIDSAYNKKLQSERPRRSRDFPNSLIAHRFITINQRLLVQTQPGTIQFTDQSFQQLVGQIDDNQMDDSHKILTLKDARIMRPAWNKKRISKFNTF